MIKNWQTKAVSTFLALSILIPAAAFASDATTDATKAVTGGKGFGQHRVFSQEKQQEMQTKLLELVTKYTPDSLAEWKAALAEQDSLMQKLQANRPTDKERPQLSDEVKAELNKIRDDLKSGTITQEQAQQKMKDLGIEPREGKDHPELSAEVKEKLDNIRDEVKNGTLTKEAAQEQIKALGIEPREDKDHPELSAEVKEKLEAIKADVESGKLTKEQAKEKMAELGLKPKGDGPKDNPMAQLKEAVDAKDATKIQELLPQMLEDLKERNQKMSNKLAESQN